MKKTVIREMHGRVLCISGMTGIDRKGVDVRASRAFLYARKSYEKNISAKNTSVRSPFMAFAPAFA